MVVSDFIMIKKPFDIYVSSDESEENRKYEGREPFLLNTNFIVRIEKTLEYDFSLSAYVIRIDMYTYNDIFNLKYVDDISNVLDAIGIDADVFLGERLVKDNMFLAKSF